MPSFLKPSIASGRASEVTAKIGTPGMSAVISETNDLAPAQGRISSVITAAGGRESPLNVSLNPAPSCNAETSQPPS